MVEYTDLYKLSDPELPSGTWVVICDAAYKNGVSGLSCNIRSNKFNQNHKKSGVKIYGSNTAELESIRYGLEMLKDIDGFKEKVVVYNDNNWVIDTCNGYNEPRKEKVISVVSKINRLRGEFGEVIFCRIPSKDNHIIDKLADKEKKKRQKIIDKRIEKRTKKLYQLLDDAKKIKIQKDTSGTYAISESDQSKKYKVSYNPFSCECTYWVKKWSNKDYVIIKKRAMPCKHIAALCAYDEVNAKEIFKAMLESKN